MLLFCGISGSFTGEEKYCKNHSSIARQSGFGTSISDGFRPICNLTGRLENVNFEGDDPLFFGVGKARAPCKPI